MASSGFDLTTYLRRIGYQGDSRPGLSTLNGLMFAHTSSIPFENLDVLLGAPIELELDAVFEKLVLARRGGYCFEHSTLFSEVLRRLGFEFTVLGGRVRLDRPRDYLPPRTHMFLRVELSGASYLADVGVGGLSLTSAVRLELDREQPTLHDPRRIVEQEGKLFHQVRLGQEWRDLYEFTLDEMPPIDREVGNWFTSTHPRSHFKSRLIVARAASEGVRLALSNDDFSVRQANGVAEHHRIETPEELLEVLRKEFGLHFPVATRFGPPGSPWPS